MSKTISKRNDEVSCVQLSRELKAKLDELGTRKDTYESIIRGLLEKSCAVKDEEPDESEEESS